MNSTKIERAHCYVAKCPPAISGQNGSGRTFGVACRLVRFGLSRVEVMLVMRTYSEQCFPKWSDSELRHKIEGAFAAAQRNDSGIPRRPIESPFGHSKSSSKAPVAIGEIAYAKERIEALAEKGPNPRNWRHWLWERSPKRPDSRNALSFLGDAFTPGETVLIFDSFEAKSPTWRYTITYPFPSFVPDRMKRGGQGKGIWFLSNPVDGEWHPNPRDGGKLSCRSEESITSFRYAVLESDEVQAAVWLRAVVQFPIAVAAIYSSGGKSIHALVRVDAKSKSEWDSKIIPVKRPLKVLGADPGALTAVRLTRLPCCWRPETSGFQKLLYLNPNPTERALVDVPIVASRAESLARWRSICPRWNPSQKGEL